MNQINVIFPYKYLGQWIFDDELKGLVKEPLDLGMPDPLEAMKLKIHFSSSYKKSRLLYQF